MSQETSNISNSESAISLVHRRKRDLLVTQGQLAHRAGLSTAMVSNVERGLKPSDDSAHILAAAYEVTVEEFWRLFRREPIAAGAAHTNGGNRSEKENATGKIAVNG